MKIVHDWDIELGDSESVMLLVDKLLYNYLNTVAGQSCGICSYVDFGMISPQKTVKVACWFHGPYSPPPFWAVLS